MKVYIICGTGVSPSSLRSGDPFDLYWNTGVVFSLEEAQKIVDKFNLLIKCTPVNFSSYELKKKMRKFDEKFMECHNPYYYYEKVESLDFFHDMV